MLLDWFFHLEKELVIRAVESTRTPPALRRLAEAGLQIRSRAVGHYRDPQGRIGAMQLLTIDQVSQFVELLNAALNEEILLFREDSHDGRRMPISVRRMTPSWCIRAVCLTVRWTGGAAMTSWIAAQWTPI